MRVYLPATFADLEVLRSTGELAPPRLAFAVTPEFRSGFAERDTDELEFAAMARAALGSLDLLVGLQHPRRVVIVADLESESVTSSPVEPAAVSVVGPVPLASVASVHVDEPDAERAVTRALRAIAAHDPSSGQALYAVEDLIDVDLLWYATQELDDVLALGPGAEG